MSFNKYNGVFNCLGMGLFFSSLLGRDGRRFIKRKDSDAGEAGMYIIFVSNLINNLIRFSTH